MLMFKTLDATLHICTSDPDVHIIAVLSFHYFDNDKVSCFNGAAGSQWSVLALYCKAVVSKLKNNQAEFNALLVCLTI